MRSSDGAASDSVDSFMRRVAADISRFDELPVLLRTGTTLAERYVVERFARRGGMGTVYQGRDLQSGSPVAIKTLGRLDSDLRSRFVREIGILAGVDHPGIVHYVDDGTSPEGVQYLVMEWLVGEDLSERLARTPLRLDETLRLMTRCCNILTFAHSRGIVHRDIKPANLFLCGSSVDAVKLLDFGVARIDETDQSLTRTGTRVGTVGYMSPEQARGERDVDARADVFALGCVLYECLTGRAPFASAHAVGILAKVLHEEPARPSVVRPELGPAFDDFLAWVLAKRREARPRDAHELLASLKELADCSPGSAPRSRRAASPVRTDQRIVSVILGQRDLSASAADVLDASLAAVGAKFGAQATPLRGGAVLLVLSSRGEANDRASQAALCALELFRRHPSLSLAVATGLVDTSGGVPVGAAIDRAALVLSQLGEVSGVVLDDVTLGLVGLRFEVERVSGKSLLLAARQDFEAPRQLLGRPTPHVGRDREIRALDEALSECLEDGVSRVVLVTGPPGIGKSRLASEWIARGGRGGRVRTLFARVDPSSAGSAWSMAALLIRDAARLREAEPRSVQLAKLHGHFVQQRGAAVNAQSLEVLADVIGLGGELTPSPLLLAARGNPEIMHEQVRRALQHWLDAEATGQPLVLVLEDLHWGDSPSLDFLVEAVRDNPHRPLLVIALARPEIERQFPEFCERAVMQLRLPGLGAKGAQQLIESVLGREVDLETKARLVRVADGNPFYLEELIRCVAAGSNELPETVIAMAQSRMDRLDATARRVLRAASVYGERCWDQGIAEIVGRGVDVAALLSVLRREEILVAVADSRYVAAGEYRFRHALLRDAAYALMTNEERCAAHGVAGNWLERNGELDERVLADHYQAAGDHGRATPLLLKAVKRAIDAGDLSATVQLANRGIAIAATELDRARLRLLRCYAEGLAGIFQLDDLRQSLDVLPVGTSLWWLGVEIIFFSASRGDKPEIAAPYLGLAREAPFEGGQEVHLGQGLLTLVGGLILLGKAALAEAILERARSAERAVSDPFFDTFMTAARCGLESVAPTGGRWHLERAFLEGRRCAAELGSLGALYGQCQALDYVAVAAMHLGLHEEARDACLQACELMRRASKDIRDPWPYLMLGKAYLRLGQPENALSAVAPIQANPSRAALQMLPIIVGEALLRQGHFAAAAAEVTAACDGASPRLQRLAACVLARARLSEGRIDEALQTIASALAARTSSGLESEIDLMNLKAECLLAHGQVDDCRRLVAETRELVLGMAASIEDASLRRSFLERVEPCARALELHEQLS